MSLSDLTNPVYTLNGYLWDTIKRIEPTFETKYDVVPFFPLSDSASGDSSWDNKTYVVYDRVLSMRRNSPFYPIKTDHISYYVKGKEEQTLEWGTAFQYILDRQDDAAKDVNDWNRNQTTPANVYFHSMRVLQEGQQGGMGSATLTRDFSVRPFYITRFVISMEYHLTDSIESILSS